MISVRFCSFLILALFLLGQVGALAHDFQHDPKSVDDTCVFCVNSSAGDNGISPTVFFAPVEVSVVFLFNIKSCPISLSFYNPSNPRAPPTIS